MLFSINTYCLSCINRALVEAMSHFLKKKMATIYINSKSSWNVCLLCASLNEIREYAQRIIRFTMATMFATTFWQNLFYNCQIITPVWAMCESLPCYMNGSNALCVEIRWIRVNIAKELQHNMQLVCFSLLSQQEVTRYLDMRFSCFMLRSFFGSLLIAARTHLEMSIVQILRNFKFAFSPFSVCSVRFILSLNLYSVPFHLTSLFFHFVLSIFFSSRCIYNEIWILFSCFSGKIDFQPDENDEFHAHHMTCMMCAELEETKQYESQTKINDN